MKTKEFIILIAFTILLLGLYVIFPAKDTFQKIATSLFFLVLIPFVFNKYIFKKTESVIDFRVGNFKKGLQYAVISLLACLLIIFIGSYFFNFLNKYSVPKLITTNFLNFILYEFFLVLPFIVMYEFYFRGFLMGIFSKKIGYWSILLQSIVFLILTIPSGDKFIQFIPYLIFSIFGGWIALKSRSLIYSATAQFILILVLNVIIIKRLG